MTESTANAIIILLTLGLFYMCFKLGERWEHLKKINSENRKHKIIEAIKPCLAGIASSGVGGLLDDVAEDIANAVMEMEGK